MKNPSRKRLVRPKWDPVRNLKAMARGLRRDADSLINHGYALRERADNLEDHAKKLESRKKLKKLLKRTPKNEENS